MYCNGYSAHSLHRCDAVARNLFRSHLLGGSMSRFYGGVMGDRGEATRCGSLRYNAYAQSNNFGIRCEYAKGTDADYGAVFLTAGRNQRTGNVLIGHFEGTTFKLNPNLAQLVEQFNKENEDE